MSDLIEILSSQFCRNLVIALAHTLWQATVIAAVFFLFLKRAKRSQSRYLAAVLAIAAVVFALLLTCAVLNYEPPPSDTPHVVATDQVRITPPMTTAHNPQRTVGLIEHTESSSGSRWIIWAMCVWLAGVMVMLSRAVHTVIGAGQLRRKCIPIEDEAILLLLSQLRKTMRIGRRIALATGQHITLPSTAGWLWPTIFLPLSMVTGVPTEDLKAVLAHELAHIKRYDYLINFCQMLIEAILFFNPALWWISRQIRIEREACCDVASIAATGQKLKYAQLLADWAKRIAAVPTVAAAPAVALAKPGETGGILDRIKRILVTGHRPTLRLSWYATTVMLIASAAVLVFLWQGTNLTVALAGKLLTPAQRIEKIKQITEDYEIEDREYGPEDRITISGRVKTHDGRPIPERTYVKIRSKRPGYTTSSSCRLSETGHFSSSINYGRIYLRAAVDGYEPAFAGPFRAESGGDINDIEMTLTEGFLARIRLVDEQQNPIQWAQLKGGYIHLPGSYSSSVEIYSDEAGLATIEHCADKPLKLKVTADGYEYDQRDFNLKPTEAATWKLKPSKPAGGVVVSEQTGLPIEGATFGLVEIKGPFSHGYDPYDGTNIIAATDHDGRFALTSLRDDTVYHFIIKADGYGIRFPYRIDAGQQNLKIRLGKELYMEGRIIGDLTILETDRSGPIIRHRNPWTIGGTGHSSGRNASVDIRDGVGYFRIDGLWPDKVWIRVSGKHFLFEINKEPLKEVTIDLTPESPEQQTRRQIILKFDVGEQSPLPEGAIRVSHVSDRDDELKRGWTYEKLEIADGQIRFEMSVPGRFQYRIDYGNDKRPAGYWFPREIQNVPVDDEPFVHTITAHPAGSIYGSILLPDGSLAENANARLFVVDKPAVMESVYGSHDVLNSRNQGNGKFNASPLPLDGRYAIIVNHRYTCVVSKTLSLNKRNPIREIEVKLPKGQTVTGRMIDTDGKPARHPVRLNARIKLGDRSYSHGGLQIRPDEQGRFSFSNVNPDIPGYYSVYVETPPGYRRARMRLKNLRKPFTVKLEKGEIVTGLVIDDATGWPVPEAKVYAMVADRVITESALDADELTDQQGRFRFTTMAKRKYQLNLRNANLADKWNRVSVTGGQTEPVTLRIKLRESSRLKPRKPTEEN